MNNNFSLIAITTSCIVLSLFIRANAISSIILGLSLATLLVGYISNYISFKTPKNIIIITLPFTMFLIGTMWSNNTLLALNYIIRVSPILLLPILFLGLRDPIILKKAIFIFESTLPKIVLFFLSFYLIFALYLYILGLGNYFFYSDFTQIIKIHTTTLSLIVLTSFIIVLKLKNKYSKRKLYLFSFLHLLFLILISSKIAFFGLLFIIIYEIVNMKSKYKLSIFLGTFLFLTVILFSVLQNRLTNHKLNSYEKNSVTKMIETFYNNDLKKRILLWKSNINSVKNKIYGYGTYPTDFSRLKEYKKTNLPNAVKYKYNAHNQYIEIYYSLGFIGLVLFFIHLYYSLKISYILGEYFLIIYIITLLFFTTETILYHSKAIILYALILVYIHGNYKIK